MRVAAGGKWLIPSFKEILCPGLIYPFHFCISFASPPVLSFCNLARFAALDLLGWQGKGHQLIMMVKRTIAWQNIANQVIDEQHELMTV